jgi:hypothetical protein
VTSKRQPYQYAQVFHKQFGKEWLDWTPECLYSELKDSFGMRPTPQEWQVIQAVKTHKKTDIFFKDANAFENMVLAVNYADPRPEELQLCTPEELAYGVAALLKTKDKPKDIDWSRDIKGYVSTCCRFDGLLRFPSELAWAETETATSMPIEPTMIESHGEQADKELDIITVQQNKLFAAREYVKAMSGEE